MADPDYVEDALGLYDINVDKYPWADELHIHFEDSTDCASLAGTVGTLLDEGSVSDADTLVRLTKDLVYGGEWGVLPTMPK